MTKSFTFGVLFGGGVLGQCAIENFLRCFGATLESAIDAILLATAGKCPREIGPRNAASLDCMVNRWEGDLEFIIERVQLNHAPIFDAHD